MRMIGAPTFSITREELTMMTEPDNFPLKGVNEVYTDEVSKDVWSYHDYAGANVPTGSRSSGIRIRMKMLEDNERLLNTRNLSLQTVRSKQQKKSVLESLTEERRVLI